MRVYNYSSHASNKSSSCVFSWSLLFNTTTCIPDCYLCTSTPHPRNKAIPIKITVDKLEETTDIVCDGIKSIGKSHDDGMTSHGKYHNDGMKSVGRGLWAVGIGLGVGLTVALALSMRSLIGVLLCAR